MNKPIIEIRGLGKKYEINRAKGKYIALRDVITNVARYPFLFLKSKFKQATGLEKKEEFWALKNIDLKIERGDVVGIIGSNGAGKSTLLKILSQITPPTEGEVVLRGRVGSLLEVGTGFHPELSGRENIFLNGAILGMKKREIEKKFDQIVDFAGIEKFLDTPVKHYSSGMYVRLAFSVAAHMEPDILIVDEVLAVGDAEFQKKCLGKMDEITKQEDRTILFVSHNLEAVRQLCSKTIVLQKGSMVFFGPTEESIATYNKTQNKSIDLESSVNRRGTGKLKITSFKITDDQNKLNNLLRHGSGANFIFDYVCDKPEEVKKVDIGLSIHKNGSTLSKLYSSYINQDIVNVQNKGSFIFKANNLPFSFGRYEVRVRVLIDGMESDWPKDPVGWFDISDTAIYKNSYLANEDGLVVILDGQWQHQIK